MQKKVLYNMQVVSLFCLQSVRDSFKTLIVELKKIEETTHSSTGSPLEGSLLAELCRHLCQFSQARQELIDLYLLVKFYRLVHSA